MFTGIVTAVGRITDVAKQQIKGADTAQLGVRVTVSAPGFLREDTRIGDSIAIEGACMTVVDMPERQSGGRPGDVFLVDVSRESLSLTAGLDQPGPVNLEHSLRMGDTLDGHMVSGHVDGMGTVARLAPVGESTELGIVVPLALARYMAVKGSVTVNGVSLTINAVADTDRGCLISINLIPHTLQVTTLGGLHEGDRVNLEVDMIARYVERMMAFQG
ncbi:MAG TPA: riboflavin synthase [Burkholderiaceae bacterium]|nr:riboflavin synthase [Burkholderiaceae bacterium]